MAEKNGPLTAYEIRVLRGMIDEYQQQQYRDQWLASGWRRAVAVAGFMSVVAVLAAAIIEITHALMGG